MATYFLFGKYTHEAMKGMSPERTAEANKLIEKFGGKVKEIYALFGEIDLVIIAEFPGNSEAMKASIALSKLTNISFKTAPALSVEEFDKLITEL
ncbi:GYD domain-containing protein [Candidatus Chrysopegis kryptomonas]|uniref:Uncharacterized protein, contains GYD domain n=1 Tax=Candidatus Chryseopegocella kryptomonas TaxID=1633643 RepID=A0A0P1NY24_9BACT|nr:GYD domain-containing protein [Candidatus Chrysopegis kryptomonas]CUT04022.1 Uncharacterized protein, contains GYD domain [Candidatus Chrysopegis kryptomonas]